MLLKSLAYKVRFLDNITDNDKTNILRIIDIMIWCTLNDPTIWPWKTNDHKILKLNYTSITNRFIEKYTYFFSFFMFFILKRKNIILRRSIKNIKNEKKWREKVLILCKQIWFL